jgi:tetratricopeptide (TPR) repeat protein
MSWRHICRVTIAVAGSGAALVHAAATPPGLPAGARPGQVLERVTCAQAPEFSYALYLPSTFDAARPSPILYVFDPRKRAVPALELFRAAAERLGFVIASSHDTESDTVAKPSLLAIRAMWEDTHARLSLAPRRAYAAGMSGGARMACILGAAAPGELSGVFLAAAGFPDPEKLPRPVGFDVFATVGTLDFNYYELRRLERDLAASGARQRVVYFEGRHGWPAADLAEQGLAWLELQSMRRALRPRDPALIEAYLTRALSAAQAAETAGDLLEAQAAYAAIASDFEGLAEVAHARAAAARLGQRPEVDSERSRRRRIDERDLAQLQRAEPLLDLLRGRPDRMGVRPEALPLLATLVRELELRELKQVAHTGQGYERASAQRRIEVLAAQLASRVPAEALERREFLRAALSYAAASEIRPTPLVFYNLACAWARAGRKQEALRALRQALAAGFPNARQQIMADSDLDGLRAEPDFRALLETLPDTNAASGPPQ